MKARKKELEDLREEARADRVFGECLCRDPEYLEAIQRLGLSAFPFMNKLPFATKKIISIELERSV